MVPQLLKATILLAAVALSSQSSAQSQSPQSVSGPEISMLIRTTIIALDQANKTGNYTVFRDLAAADLRSGTTAATLSDMFRPFREKRLNLAPTVLVDARLPNGPQLTTDGYLRVQGFFPTRPEEVIFDLMFAFEAGEWRVASANVGTRPTDEMPRTVGPSLPSQSPGQQSAVPPLPRPRPDPGDVDAALEEAARQFRESPELNSSAGADATNAPAEP